MRTVSHLDLVPVFDDEGRPVLKDNKPVMRKPVPDFMLVILPEHAAELRKATKWWGDVLRAVPTQCVVRSVLLCYCPMANHFPW